MCACIVQRGLRNDLKTLCYCRFQTIKLKIYSLSLVVTSFLKQITITQDHMTEGKLYDNLPLISFPLPPDNSPYPTSHPPKDEKKNACNF